MYMHNKEILVFDFETSGFSAQKDRPIQLSLMQIKNFKEIFRFSSYIYQDIILSEEITKLTGISQKTLMSAPKESSLINKVAPLFDNVSIICGHNVTFDIRFLEALFKRHRLVFNKDQYQIIDTMKLAKKYISKSIVNNYKLEYLTQKFNLNAGLSAHNAMDDVIATARLLWFIQEKVINNT